MKKANDIEPVVAKTFSSLYFGGLGGTEGVLGTFYVSEQGLQFVWKEQNNQGVAFSRCPRTAGLGAAGRYRRSSGRNGPTPERWCDGSVRCLGSRGQTDEVRIARDHDRRSRQFVRASESRSSCGDRRSGDVWCFRRLQRW
jgi:hypothetical protein